VPGAWRPATDLLSGWKPIHLAFLCASKSSFIEQATGNPSGRVRCQLGKSLQKNIRFGFAAEMKAIAHDAVKDLVKEIADSGLLDNRHGIAA
jgi:hypothetical protein